MNYEFRIMKMKINIKKFSSFIIHHSSFSFILASCILHLASAFLLLTTSLYARDVYLQLIAHGQRLDIGISEFTTKKAVFEESKLAGESRRIIRNDLIFTKMFDIIEGGPAYTGRSEELRYWGRLNADILLSAAVSLNDTILSVDAKLIDVESEKEIWSKIFSEDISHKPNIRKLAHKISDEIILRLTGEKGIASSKITFINDYSGAKEVYTIDYDGYNLQRISYDNSISLLPKYSPDGKEIIYTTYRYGNPDLYSIDTASLKKRPVSTRQGLNTAASFAPNSETIALTMSRGRYPNIYLIDREGEIQRQLTTHPGIDTSPSFSPSGNEIVFISNRAGYPQLYIMNVNGSNVRRVSTRGHCDSPSWSPKGDRIAFTMMDDFKHNIFVYDLRSGRVSQLTYNAGNNENPSWSPDGRFISFISTRHGKKELFRMFIDGSGQSRIADIPGRSFTPNWSPRLY